MEKKEFETRVKVEVSDGEFEAINVVYMNSDLDKDSFCKLWVKMNKNRVANARVERIIKAKEEAEKDTLFKWYNKTHAMGFNAFSTRLAYSGLNLAEILAMSHAGIHFENNEYVGDVRYEVGKFLGIIK